MLAEFGFAIGAIVILSLTFYDITWTCLSASETGPVSFRVMTFYKSLSQIFRPLKGVHHILRAIGLMTFLTTIFIWYLCMWIGWSMIFFTVPGSVVSGTTGNPATYFEKFYFTGWVVFTAGIGDFHPVGNVFLFFTALGNCLGLFMVAITVAYLIGATDAVTRQRQLAGQIAAMGSCPVDVILNTWNGKDIEILDSNLRSLADDISQCAQQLVRFPLIFNFHSVEVLYSPVVKIAVLDETLTIIECFLPKELQLTPLGKRQVRNAINQYFSALARIGVHNGPHHVAPEFHSVDKLKEAGIPTVSSGQYLYNISQTEVTRRRILLKSLVQESTRKWEDVYGGTCACH
jgi:hypothetical protein